jgi:hypothetical protein
MHVKKTRIGIYTSNNWFNCIKNILTTPEQQQVSHHQRQRQQQLQHDHIPHWRPVHPLSGGLLTLMTSVLVETILIRMTSVTLEILIAEVVVVGDGLDLIVHDPFSLATLLLLQSLSFLLCSLNGRKLSLLQRSNQDNCPEIILQLLDFNVDFLSKSTFLHQILSTTLMQG